MFICKFCKKECKNKNSLINHERLCKSNPDRKISPLIEYWTTKPKQWNKGLTKENDERIKKGIETFKKSIESGKYKPHKTPHSKETREYLSKKMHERYASGWECVCGRSKKYDYKSPIAGNIKVDGTWELLFCKYLDMLKLNWRRNKERFKYTNIKGTVSTYQPDFYVEEWDSYVEIKGYETDLDLCKWEQFPEKLIIIKKEEIEIIKGRIT